MTELLHFPPEEAAKLEPHLPPSAQRGGLETSSPPGALPGEQGPRNRPFVTLTFATSLDSALSLAPGTRTALSGPQSKAMTHFLRSRHDAICIGVGTAVADDPGLNCRIAGVSSPGGQPRPIVIDPHDRWPLSVDSKVLHLARLGQGLAPFIVTSVRDPPAAKRELLESHGGKYIFLDQSTDARAGDGQDGQPRFQWDDILRLAAGEGLQSIMIEGGGQIINSLLDPVNNHLIDSVIVTIAPTWLGQGGVVVSPNRVYGAGGRPIAAARLRQVSWQQLGEDVILCGRINR